MWTNSNVNDSITLLIDINLIDSYHELSDHKFDYTIRVYLLTGQIVIDFILLFPRTKKE